MLCDFFAQNEVRQSKEKESQMVFCKKKKKFKVKRLDKNLEHGSMIV